MGKYSFIRGNYEKNRPLMGNHICNKEKDSITVIMEIDRNLYETMKNDRIFMSADKTELDNMVRIKFNTDEINRVREIAKCNYQRVKIIEPQFLIDNIKEMCRNLLGKY